MDVLKRLALAAALLPSGCAPEFANRSSLVREPRILAVRADPPEAAPGESVRFTALLADGAGALSDAPLDWAFCLARTPLAQLGPADPSCIAPEGPVIAYFGAGTSTMGALPIDGCRLFGPNPPVADDGQAGGRPVDPDATGGYYQPLRVLLGAGPRLSYALYAARIACGVSGTTQSVAAEFVRRYVRNANPRVQSLALANLGSTSPETELRSGEATELPVGARVRLRVRWPSCESGGACDGAERYVVYDRLAKRLREAREAMRVAWYATAGAFADERSGQPGDELAPRESTNEWTAPDAPGDVSLWVVLRDDRGGTAFERFVLRITPR